MANYCYNTDTIDSKTYVPYILLHHNYESMDVLNTVYTNKKHARNTAQVLSKLEKKLKKQLDVVYKNVLNMGDDLRTLSIDDRLAKIRGLPDRIVKMKDLLNTHDVKDSSGTRYKIGNIPNDNKDIKLLNNTYTFLFSKLLHMGIVTGNSEFVKMAEISEIRTNYINLVDKKVSFIGKYLDTDFKKIMISWLENGVRVEKNINDTLERIHLFRKQIQEYTKLVRSDDGEDEIVKKYIFVGTIPSNVTKILEEIANTRVITLEHDNILEKQYGTEYKKHWGVLSKENYTEIHFMPYYILPNSTIYYVQRIIQAAMNIRVEHQYLWAYLNFNNSLVKKAKMEELYYKLHNENVGVSRDSIISFLVKNGISHRECSDEIFNDGSQRSQIEDDYSSGKITDEEHRRLLDDVSKQHYSINDITSMTSLNNILSSYLQYKNLGFTTYANNMLPFGQWPYENPFYIFLKPYDKDGDNTLLASFDELRSTKALSYSNDISNTTLHDIGKLNSNEINLVSLSDFYKFHIVFDVNARAAGGGAVYMSKYIKQIYARFFYSVETQEQLKNTSQYKASMKELEALTENNRIIDLYLNSGKNLVLPSDIDFNLSCKSIVEIKIHISQLPYVRNDLRDIFNRIILNKDIVFVRFYDDQRVENIYKIHKSSFGNHKIGYDVLNRWLSRETFVLNLGKLTKTKEPKKLLTYKLKLCNQQISTNKRKIKSRNLAVSFDSIKRYNVYYVDGSYDENIEEYLIEDDYVYEYSPVFLDFNFQYGRNVFDCRMILNPVGISNPLFYTLYTKAIDKFVDMIRIIPSMKNYRKPGDDLIQNRITLYNEVDNLSSIINLRYKSDKLRINYTNLRNIANVFSPFVYIIEPFYTKGTSVKVFEKGTWMNGVVSDYNIVSDTYNVDIIGIKSSRSVKPHYIKLETEKGTGAFINMRYKRVSGFVQDTPIMEFLKRHMEWNISMDKIVEKMTQQFNVNEQQIETLNAKVEQTRQQIADNRDRRAEVNGIDIKFFMDYESEDNGFSIYRVELNHYRNIDDYYSVCKLLDCIFRLYFHVYNVPGTNVLDEYNITINDPRLMELKQRKADELAVQEKKIERAELEDFGLGDFLGPDEDEDEPVQEEVKQIVERGKREQLEESNILDFDEEMIGTSANSILERLYKADRKMFFWESENEKQKYTIKCQPNSRYPKVVGEERFKYIMSKYKLGLGTTYIGNKDVDENPTDVRNEAYCDPKTHIKTDDKCVSIKYGSQEEANQWNKIYMCPKIWCARCNIPLHPRHLKNVPTDLCSEFISEADLSPEELSGNSLAKFLKTESSVWHICKTCSRDIVEHEIKCPECNGGVLDSRERNVIPTQTKTLIILPKNSKNYIYPGLIKGSNHPDNIPAVCCFNNANSRLDDKFSYKNNKAYFATNTYIQGFGKELLPGRFGQMPPASSGFMDLDMNYFRQNNIRCENNGKNYCYRYGVMPYSNLNCISVLAFYFLIENAETSKDQVESFTYKMLDIILTKITDRVLERFPILHYSFRNSSVSTLQNYMEFLISGDDKPDFTILQLLNKNLEWLGKSSVDMDVLKTGVNIFISSVNDDGKMVIETLHGYIQPYQLGVRAKSILLFRNGNVLEPVVFTSKECSISGASGNKIIKFLDWDSEIVKKIVGLIRGIPNWESAPKAIFNNKFENKYLDLIDMSAKTIDWFLKKWHPLLLKYNKELFSISKIVVDNNNMVLGVLFTNNVMLPVYPTVIDSSIKYENIQYIKYLESGDLPSFSDVVDFYSGLHELPGKLIGDAKGVDMSQSAFKHLQLIKSIKSVKSINSDREYSGFFTIGGCIVPFNPTSSIGNINLQVVYLDYYKVERSIMDYRENYKFTPHLEYKKVLLDSDSYVYVINSGKLVGLNIIVTSINLVGVYIPLQPVEWSGPLPKETKRVDKYTVYSFSDTIEKYHKLYSYYNGKVPCRVVGLRMNTDKNIKDVMLETGDYVAVIPDTPLYAKIGDDYLITHIQNMEVADIFSDDVAKYDKLNLDDRVQFITTMDYNKFSYERFRFEVARLLSVGESTHKQIDDLVKNRRLNLNEKRDILSNMLVEMTRHSVMYKKTSVDSVNTGQKFLEQTCSIHAKRDQCSADPFCQWLDYTKDMDFDKYKATHYKKIHSQFLQVRNSSTTDVNMLKYIKSVKKYVELNGRQWYELTSDENMEHNIQNKLEIDYMRNGKCKLLLRNDEDVDFIHSKYIRRLTDDLLRNPIKRREVMENSIKIVDTKLSYNVYPEEIFYTEQDIKQRTQNVKMLYSLNRRSRLGIMDHFTKNNSNFKLDVIENDDIMLKKLRDTTYNIKDVTNLVEFNILPTEIFTVDSVYNYKNVKIVDKTRALHEILRVNTPLTKYFVTRVDKNVVFNIVEHVVEV
jgi:hypothetical protein